MCDSSPLPKNEIQIGFRGFFFISTSTILTLLLFLALKCVLYCLRSHKLLTLHPARDCENFPTINDDVFFELIIDIAGMGAFGVHNEMANDIWIGNHLNAVNFTRIDKHFQRHCLWLWSAVL